MKSLFSGVFGALKNGLYALKSDYRDIKDYYKEIYGVELTDEQVERMYNPEAHAAEGTQK